MSERIHHRPPRGIRFPDGYTVPDTQSTTPCICGTTRAGLIFCLTHDSPASSCNHFWISIDGTNDYECRSCGEHK